MTDERDEERDGGSAEQRRRRFRVVSAPAETKPLVVGEDELRELIRQVQRPARRRDLPPSDDPLTAA